MIITHQLDQSFILSRTLPNALPVNVRRSKGWRSYFIGRYDSLKNLRETVFYIFVIDLEFGFRKHAAVHGRHLSVRRKGKTYLRFQCGHPKDRVMIVAIHSSAHTEDGLSMFDALHKNFIERMTELDEVMWQPSAGVNRGKLETFTDFAVQCNDSFAETAQ